MKTRLQLLSLLVITLTQFTLLAQEPAAVIDAAKFKTLQAPHPVPQAEGW
jgi:hypothetical protein